MLTCLLNTSRDVDSNAYPVFRGALGSLANHGLCPCGGHWNANSSCWKKIKVSCILHIHFFLFSYPWPVVVMLKQGKFSFFLSYLYFYLVAWKQDKALLPISTHRSEVVLTEGCLFLIPAMKCQRGKAQAGQSGHYIRSTEICFRSWCIAQRDLNMPLTPGWDKRNLLPNMLGINENHSLEGAQGGRNKNKRKGKQGGRRGHV